MPNYWVPVKIVETRYVLVEGAANKQDARRMVRDGYDWHEASDQEYSPIVTVTNLPVKEEGEY